MTIIEIRFRFDIIARARAGLRLGLIFSTTTLSPKLHGPASDAQSAQKSRVLSCAQQYYWLTAIHYETTLACDDIMPTGWTPAAASSTLEEWSRTFSRTVKKV